MVRLVAAGLKRAQQASISIRHLIEREDLANTTIVMALETALGAGGREFESRRPDQFTL